MMGAVDTILYESIVPVTASLSGLVLSNCGQARSAQRPHCHYTHYINESRHAVHWSAPPDMLHSDKLDENDNDLD